MYIDIKPSTLIGRGYDTEGGYELREPYQLVFSVFLSGDGEAFIHAMNGSQVTLHVIGKIAAQLHEQYGVVKLVAERNGRKVTYDVERILARVKALQ